jgi:hypothetical protein
MKRISSAAAVYISLAPKAQHSPLAWGSAPGLVQWQTASAESAIHSRVVAQLFKLRSKDWQVENLPHFFVR